MLELQCLFLFISLLGFKEGDADQQALSQHVHVVTLLVSLPPLITSSSTDLIALKDIDCDKEASETNSLPVKEMLCVCMPDCIMLQECV